MNKRFIFITVNTTKGFYVDSIYIDRLPPVSCIFDIHEPHDLPDMCIGSVIGLSMEKVISSIWSILSKKLDTDCISGDDRYTITCIIDDGTITLAKLGFANHRYNKDILGSTPTFHDLGIELDVKLLQDILWDSYYTQWLVK